MHSCSVCDREYPRKGPWRCSCGAPLDYATQALPDSRPEQFSRASGVWDFADFLPMGERVSLGEGWTPLVDAPGWDATFKLEYLHPTGSFKDRGAATVVAEALEVGADRVLEDSSGNAGLAVASYAARAGLDAEIYVPANAKETKVRRIERTGADVVPVEGSRESVTAACIDAVESGAGWYASHAWNPAFFSGTATAAYEIAAQRNWTVPDAVVTPLGHGTMFLGLYGGFRALEQAGWRTLSHAYSVRRRPGTAPSPTGTAVRRATPTTSPTGFTSGTRRAAIRYGTPSTKPLATPSPFLQRQPSGNATASAKQGSTSSPHVRPQRRR